MNTDEIALKPEGPVVPASEVPVWTEARKALEEAGRWAEAKKARARAAYRKEKQRGYREGFREGAAAAAELMAETTAVVERHVAGLESALPSLVLDIVEQLLGRFDPGEVMARVIAKALSTLRADAKVTLCVAPDMAEIVGERLSGLLPDGGGALVDIEADAGLSGTACTMKSAFGIVELDVDAQLEVLRRGLGDPDAGSA